MSTVNSTTSADVIAALQKSSASSTSKTDEAQSRFLKLLTEQLKNQDPLNPMDNAQMTSQLAQISTVDGISKLNTTLTALLQDSQSSEAMQAAALVGKGVMVEGKALTLSGSKAYGGFELTSAADKVTVTIKDSAGTEVRKMELGSFDAGVFNFAWDGKTTNGTQAVDGKYTMSIAATRGSDDVKPIALQLTTVNSVLRTSKGEVSLDVGSGNLVSLTDIKQIL
ncbi:flagellar hook assembly protein FlgD [Zoogloea dura]|jgi:flagellar basal-body rod modification protein FlgD|uniref:Basal-body rod modification protein FlgD n=1 Tax=Zoogloea dura TaxID=2728840 RepID=A0A848GBN7_9RHOO|nr:flagellar hook assembly protein FlgD [Zoogloea dura]NML28275.1 flagellar hook assembly protein FlgD [Zoogloea dura]